MVVVPAFTMGSPPGATSRDDNEPVAAGKLDEPVDQFAAFVGELAMKDRNSTSGSRIRSEIPGV
jgi:hypothetical protein